MLDNISKLQLVKHYNEMAFKQLKYPCISEKSNIRSFYKCYLKDIKRQVTLSTQLGRLRVCINSSFFGYFDGLERSMF